MLRWGGTQATVVLGKAAHYGLLWALPWALHGPAATAAGAAAYMFTHRCVFPIISHTVMAQVWVMWCARQWFCQSHLSL